MFFCFHNKIFNFEWYYTNKNSYINRIFKEEIETVGMKNFPGMMQEVFGGSSIKIHTCLKCKTVFVDYIMNLKRARKRINRYLKEKQLEVIEKKMAEEIFKEVTGTKDIKIEKRLMNED